MRTHYPTPRFATLLLATLLCALASLSPNPAWAQTAAKAAKIVVSPAGATLRAGETVTFSAVVLDKRGNVLPDIPITWRSYSNAVLTVAPDGTITATGVGKAMVQAKAKKKIGKAPVNVVDDSGSTEKIVASGLQQVNHILSDDEWIYWCETSTKVTRIRKTLKTGGAIIDLATEPFRSRSGLTTTYAQLQQIGDQLYFTRQQKGFNFHWSIFSVPKAGGAVTVVLPDDAGQEPLATNAWRAVNGKIFASLAFPNRVGLGGGVRVASYDPETATWSAFYSGPLDSGDTHIIAADNTHLYLRGFTFSERLTRIVKVALDGSASPETLLTRSGVDTDIDEPGATDGINLYFWSNRDATHRLLSLPITGGEPTTLLSNAFGPGLTYSDGHLYWARLELNVVKLPTTGGATIPVRANIYATAAVGGLPIDNGSLYLAVVITRTEMRIIRADP